MDQWTAIGACALLLSVYFYGVWAVACDKRDGKETNNDFGM